MTNFYFTDRKFNLINIVSTEDTTILFDVAEDVQSIEESARVFQGAITIDENKQTIENWNKASDMTSVGNYILYKDRQNESVFITIESQDADPVDFTIDIVGHDAGIDLINEIVDPWKPDKAYTVKEYIEKATWDSGFEIGINEAPNLSRKLTGWQSTDDTALKRILAIAKNFDVELDFSFDVSGLDVIHRYINIYRKRGTDDNVTLYVDKELEKIVTKKDIFDLCTSIKAEGGEDEKTKKNVNLKGYKWTDPDKRFTLNDDGILRDTQSVQLWSRLLSNENPNPIHHHIQRYMKYETKNKATLLANALRDLKKRSQVAVNYEVDILEFPSLVKIGDTIKLVDEKRSLYLSARVLKLTYDYVTERAMATLGDYLIQEGRISTSLADLANELKGRVSDVNGRIDKMGMYAAYANSADGITDFSRELEEPPQLYIGYSILDSDNPEDFTWSLYRGKDGKGVESGKVEYQSGTSGTNPPTGTWVNNPPSVDPGQFLWSRTTLSYTDGTSTIAYNVGRMGMNGAGGVGIKQVDIEYQSGNSGTTPPTETWSTTIPNVSANQYLWTRKVTTLTNDEKTTEYNVGKMGADGNDAQLLYLTATAENMAFNADDTAKPNQTITISAKLQNVSGTVTFKAVPYVGDVAQTAISLTGNGNDRTLDSSNWTNKDWTLIAITATLGNLNDTLSVVKVKDGKTPYFHTAWANSSDGATNFSTTVSLGKKYIGTYTDFTQNDSVNPATYQWTELVGALEIGGRNYFLNSKYYLITPKGTDNYDWADLEISPNFWDNSDRNGTEMIKISFTFKAKNALSSDFNGAVYFRSSPGYRINFTYPKNTTEAKKYELSYTIRDANFRTSSVFIRFMSKDTADYPFEISNAKLEVGTKATDWSPAPEDQVSKSEYDTDKININNRFTALAIPVVSQTAPSNPVENQQWWQTDSGGNVKAYFVRKGSTWQAQVIDQAVLNIIELNSVRVNSSTITGSTISGSEFKNSGEYQPADQSNVTVQYDTSIKGLYDMIWKIKNSDQQGRTVFDPLGIHSTAYLGQMTDTNKIWEWNLDSSGLLVSQGKGASLMYAKLGIGGIQIQDANVGIGARLTLSDLREIPSTNFSSSMFKSGYANYGSGPNQCQYSRTLRIVQLTGTIRNLNTINPGYDVVVMAVLPYGVRPERTVNLIAQGSGVSRFLLQIRENGEICVGRYVYGNSIVEIASGSWLNIAAVYYTGDD